MKVSRSLFGVAIGVALSSFSIATFSQEFSVSFDVTSGESKTSLKELSQPVFSSHIQQFGFNRLQIIQLTFGGFSGPLRIAEDSRPQEGFYRLETVASETGRNHNVGYIYRNGDVTFSVIKLPGQPKYEIVESNAKTQIRQVRELHSQPLTPKLPTSHSSHKKPLTNQGITTSLKKTAATEVAESQQQIDVLILFDPRLMGAFEEFNNAEFYDFTTRLAAADNLTNSIFERSGLDVSHKVAAIVPYQPNATGSHFPIEDSTTILSELYSSNYIKRLKDRYRADTVHFIGAEDAGVCGRAYYGNNLTLSNEHEYTAFSALTAYSRLTCLGGGTYPHELGHNLSFRHDRVTLSNDSLGSGNQEDFHIPYGYVEPTGQFYTNMAYGSSCYNLEGESQCLDEAVYSSPDIFLNDIPMGLSEAEQNAANNARAGSITSPIVARLNSFSQLHPISQTITGEGNISISWPTLTGAADYRLRSNNCIDSEFFFKSDFDEAVVTSDTQASFSSNSTWADATCVYARFEDERGNSSYALVGQSSLAVSLSGFGDDYLYPSSNILDLFSTDESQTLSLTVSDSSVSNDSIKLAVPVASNGSLNMRADGIQQADSWFDYSVRGSGTERTLSISLKQSIDDIADSLSDEDSRSPYVLPVRIVNTSLSEYSVYNTLWLNPQGTLPKQPAAYYGSSSDLRELEEISGHIELLYLESADTVTLTQISEQQLNNFSFDVSSTQTPYGLRKTITFNGQVPAVDTIDILELQISSSNSEINGQGFLYRLLPQAIPPTIDSIENNTVIAGDTALIKVFISDEDRNIDWSTAELTLTKENPEGSTQTSVYTPSIIDESAGFTQFNISDLDIGQYPILVSILDTDGNLAEMQDAITVQENQPPVINDISSTSATITETRQFTLSASAVDPEEEALTIEWKALNGADATFSQPTELTTDVEGLTPGDYEFQLSITDPRGATASASVDVTVIPNQAPEVNASVSPSSPTTSSSVSLSATASDTDGEIVSTLWQQMSGPDVSLSEPSDETQQLGQLSQGDYSFSFTASDDIGASTSYTVNFTVSAPPPPPPQNEAGSSSGGSTGPIMIVITALFGIIRRLSYSNSE